MKTAAAQAASLIRKELKAVGIEARVRSENYAGGNSVRAYVSSRESLTEEQKEQALSILRKYEYGSFDGQTDSYNFDNRNDSIPQVRFTFLETETGCLI